MISGVLIAVVVQLGLAAAFFVDAAQTNRTYDELSAHKIAVTGHVVGCTVLGHRASQGPLCRVAYQFRGQHFIGVIESGQSNTYFVDPLDTAIRLNKTTFDNGPRETIGDFIFAGILLFGAALVITIHQRHKWKHGRQHRNAYKRSDR